VHPVVLPDADQAKALASDLNEHLRADGYSLRIVGEMSGLPVYGSGPMPPTDASVTQGLRGLGPDYICIAWEKALRRRATDPDGAITAARSLLESTLKHVLHEANVRYAAKDDLPKLYRKAADVLELAPDGQASELLRRIAGGCRTVVEGLGALRNRVSDAHGRAPDSVPIGPRHAELAVALAGALSLFLCQTWAEQRERPGPHPRAAG